MLEGQVAVVTGASRGIGAAIAKRLAKEGAFVIVNYQGSQERAEQVKKEIEEAGGRAALWRCDVSDAAECQAMLEGVRKEYGAVDILVNNAGINRDGLLLTMSQDDFDRVVKTNLYGCFYCTKAAAKGMIKKRSGRIVNISSVSGVLGNAGQANYAASKAGIIGFTKTAARELAGRGVTVNAIAPGFIETDMTGKLSEDVRTAAAAQIPLKRFGKPEDIAAAVAFLASPEAGYITGQVLGVDGGMAM
ncbi:MAG: 3-oxoacyl-[acyl-carrier-protein] reductase [Lachnospiraceae bacterium]|nr:3-oxoacyl-[acyl-carrier-protein] reductase [Lachnospiraceae bacterium]